MSRIYSHVNTAKTILTFYKGEMPFSAFLKNLFAKEKKFGSRDRRAISSICYNYYRAGAAIKNFSFEEALLVSHFLLSSLEDEWLQNERPEWNKRIALPLHEKLKLAGIDANGIFPFNSELSAGIDVHSFNASFLIQPDLFIRIRPEKQANVRQKLAASQISFKEINESCIALSNATNLEEVVDINREAVVQDLSSQRVAELLTLAEFNKRLEVWDCCAASGGKSIMIYDLLKNVALTVSDVRLSIIRNLVNRFKKAEIKNYTSFVGDVTNSHKLKSTLFNKKFDLIICDAPCSGSGTWSRTPEQLAFFKQSEINRYSNLQKSIAANAILYLKKSGYFLYITCSVFKKENEDVVEWIEQHSNLSLIKKKIYTGYSMRADTMFAALFSSK